LSGRRSQGIEQIGSPTRAQTWDLRIGRASTSDELLDREFVILTAQAFEHRLRLTGEPRGLRAAQLRAARASLSRATFADASAWLAML
jgi:hypothetical protein